jgi:3-isopropylmalate/(R)-2-methylmalate dehydratase large subunit
MIQNEVNIRNNVLYLTEDESLLKRQLDGERLEFDAAVELINNISTDEITPGWTCFWYDETLGKYSLVGLRNGLIKPDTIKSADVDVLVCGQSKGCGSSRETAPYSEKMAGVKLIIAKSFEKIYAQNCRNIGLLTSTDFGLLSRIKSGESIPIAEFTEGLDPISAKVVEMGGLFKYNQARLRGDVAPPAVLTSRRPMTLVEKIISRKATNLASDAGNASVKPGDATFCQADVRFSHDYVTAMLASLFYSNFGKDAVVAGKESIFAFRDHLTFVNQVLARTPEKVKLIPLATNMAVEQRHFCERQGIKLYDELPNGAGSQAICHNAVLEDIALPGQLIIGTDSHTCTAGAIGAFAFGVGATDMANAYLTKDIQVKVPDSIKIDVVGKPRPGVAAKDVILHIMAGDYFKKGQAIGQVMEYSGTGLKWLSMDERATLTNMAVEAGAMTGIVEADDVTAEYVRKRHGSGHVAVEFLRSDEDASFAHRITVDLGMVEPTVALPGDPRNGISMSDFNAQHGKTKIDIAYGGSCTGGKQEDMDMYAEVFSFCRENNLAVNENVKCYIQFGSQAVKRYAEGRGYLSLFNELGVATIEPSCGACINAGPGVSDNSQQVSISAINRNFPGRSGPGAVYLASPFTVAASAIAGFVCDFDTLKSTVGKRQPDPCHV